MYDLILKNASIVDGTGADMYTADIGIKAERIMEIGKLDGAEAAEVIDASGKLVAPGFIDTAMTQALSEEVRKEWASKIPLRRGGTTEDIANTALYLASDLSSYVSGQVIQVDGGMNM